MEELYYLQDKRSYVGNDILWWAKSGMGYTTDLSKAEVYTKEKALNQHQCRESDIPWPKKYVDQHTRPAVDMQYVDISVALQGTGIELVKPQKPRKETPQCYGCGRLMSMDQYYSGTCENCETDNRP